MSILDSILGQYGGSITDAAKKGIPQMSILESLGLGKGVTDYTKPIGPTQGTGAPMDSQMIDPQQYSQMQGSSLADIGRNLSTWGAGVSNAAGPTYGPPKDFGQVIAGGTEAINKQGDKDLDRQKTLAEIGLYNHKANEAPKAADFEASAQAALIKKNMGSPLTPQEEATLQSYDTINQSKVTYSPDAYGNFVGHPAARSILTPGNQAGQKGPEMQQLRGYFDYLKNKAGQP